MVHLFAAQNGSWGPGPCCLFFEEGAIAIDLLQQQPPDTMVLDVTTGRKLPDSAIQRVLFITSNVHVYQIPPLTSNKGFTSASWTSTQPTAREIFTARLRIVETSLDNEISTAIALEDADSGALFAAAPYTSTAVVQPALDSSRFFAVRVQGEGGMKATLGIGFEDRSPAFDFGIALSEAQKVLGIAGVVNGPQKSDQAKLDQAGKQDFSLKEGEKIHIQVGSKGRRQPASTSLAKPDEGAALFSIAPPPAPSKPDSSASQSQSAQAFGFDDGEFGEFQ